MVYEECDRLLIKGFETLWRQTGANSTLLNRQLEERTKFFENQIQQNSAENSAKEADLREKLFNAEKQAHELIAKDKLMQEKLAQLNEANAKLQSQVGQMNAKVE